MNAEVDSTIGPILRVHGKSTGRSLRLRRDEPGEMNLCAGEGLGSSRAWSEREGPAGPLPQPDHPEGRAERWGRMPGWHLLRRLSRSVSRSRSSPTPPASRCRSRGMSRGLKSTLDHGDPEALRHRRAGGPSAASSTTRWDRRSSGVRARRARDPSSDTT